MHLKYKETKDVIRVSYRVSKHVSPHLHNALELVYVTEGSLELGVGQELYHMEKGDLGFVFPDVIHHYQVFCNTVSTGYYIQALPPDAGVIAEELKRSAPKCPVLKSCHIPHEVKSAIKVIVGSGKNETVVMKAYIQIILAKCLPKLKMVEKASVGSQDLVYQAVAYVSAHFREPLSLDKMAMDLGVSKYVLSRVFSGTFHRNFNQYVNDARLTYAGHCLENTSDTILDIANDSGFDSQRTFNRVFKERYRVTPSEYRRNQRCCCRRV